MSSASRLAVAALAALPLLAGGCVTEESAAVQEYLDPQTAMTIRVVSEPFLYAHDVPELAANVRDYLSVGAAELNNMGARKQYLALISWSTIDRKRTGVAPLQLPEGMEMTLAGKDRAYPLTTHEPRSIGIGTAVLEPPIGYQGESWYLVSAADLRSFAAAPPPTIDVLAGGERVTYTLWKRADAPLAKFLDEMPTALTSTPRPR